MILWFIVGFIVWALCILFMLAIFKGGSTTYGYEQKLHYRNMGPSDAIALAMHEYDQKLHYRNMVNTQKVRNSIRGVAKGTAVLAQCINMFDHDTWFQKDFLY